MSLADRITEAMEARDLSAVQASKASGIPYPTLKGILNGHQKGSTRLAELARVLGVQAVWLATGKGPRDLSPVASGILQDASQSSNTEALILRQAQSWVAFEESPGEFHPMRRLERTMELVQQIRADGGFLAPERAAAIIEAKRAELEGGTGEQPTERGRGKRR